MAAQHRAVVVGASMAGLLTARVLADHVGSVTIIDRDDLPDGPDPRKGVPQGRHAHGLLPAGEQVIRDLFPGLIEELIAGGAQRVTSPDGRWWQCGGYRVGVPEAPEATFFSRPYLERGVRARVEGLPNVSITRGAVRHLEVRNGRVCGVAVDVGEGDGILTELTADIVVDTCGRGSQASRWLERLSYEPPAMDQVYIDLTYSSRLYRRTPGRLPDRTWIISIGDPADSKRMAVAFPIEGDRWIVTLAGCHGDHPPTDDAGFATFAAGLPTDDIVDIVRNEEPLAPAVLHRFPSNQWRRFDKLERHPAGFVALGDSICSFNPVYGQGISSAAQQAAALGACIQKHGLDAPDLWRSFYKQARKVIANPWAIAAGGDFSYADTTGAKPRGTDLINRYVRRVVIAAQHDVRTAAKLYDVQGLVAAPPSLMKPPTLLRVLRLARRGPTGRPFRSSIPTPSPA
ncbi:MAG: hypothetical protein QOJ19_3657 [Acidimicrobiia bacterium]|nr:hypothetical protein [Acidimicrobiia bacterium]